MNYPVKSLFEFFNNHKLLHGKKDRPKWLTVSGGSINYVNKIINFLRANPRVKLLKNNGVKKIKRKNGFIEITDNEGNTSEVDHIIFSQNPSKVVNILSDIQKNELYKKTIQSTIDPKNVEMLYKNLCDNVKNQPGNPNFTGFWPAAFKEGCCPGYNPKTNTCK